MQNTLRIIPRLRFRARATSLMRQEKYSEDIRESFIIQSVREKASKTDVICNRLNFLGIEDVRPGVEVRCKAKIRYHHKPADATLTRIDDERLKVTFDEPVRAATPGQSSVFYDENGCVLGGGIIIA